MSNIIKAQTGDPVNHPSHYLLGGKYEVIDIMEAALSQEGFKEYCRGNIIKYIFRAPKKNGLEDLKKAQWYLNKLIDVSKNVRS